MRAAGFNAVGSGAVGLGAAGLTEAGLAGYPPEGRAFATAHLALLRELPFAYLVVLLRELKGLDWKLPAERRRLTAQVAALEGFDAARRAQVLAGFAAVRVEASLYEGDWAAAPAETLERLTAWLWSSHQMDAFRQAADGFAEAMTAAVPPAAGGPAASNSSASLQARLGVVVVGAGVAKTEMPLFRKLRPHGVYLRRVQPEGGFAVLLAEVKRRAAAAAGARVNGRADEFLHWYIDGGLAVASAASPTAASESVQGSGVAPVTGLVEVSYGKLAPVRRALLERTEAAIQSGGMGPERLRSLLARMQPEDVGLVAKEGDRRAAILNHFQLSLLTEGSGTQIFSTTFVQWAARECLRRAEPETLLLRFTPRQAQQPMNVMLSGKAEAVEDPEGSLVDADMGAYYTWLNLRRLPGSEQMRFLVWFEGHGEAVAIGPGLPGGTSSESELDMRGVLKLLA